MSDWRPPDSLPDLRHADVVAIDTETKDDALAADRGSGWATRQGYICGVSIAYRAEADIRALYFPLRHPDTNNFDPAQVYAWLKDHITANLRFVTQNGLYDWGWLRTEADIRMPPSERLEEIGALATMVDENRYRYSLDSLCEWRGLPRKDTALLLEGCEALGLIPKRRRGFIPQSQLWRLPVRYVGPYAEADAVNTLLLFESLNPILDKENTRGAYRLECDLLEMVLEMQRRGVRIDVAAAERARDQLLAKRDAVLAELSDKLGTPVSMHEIAGRKWLAETFDREKIKYPRTEKGNPSFTGGQSGWMDTHPHWLPQLIYRANRYHNAGANFIGAYILEFVVNGRIHANVHPHRSEANGTKSFRFSYSNPPLQLMSARDEELSPLIRGLFLPEQGQLWAEPDASQQEFRFAVHYAICHNVPKAKVALERYQHDPDTDFHALTAAMTGLDRGSAKNVNFAKIYGAGVKRFAAMIRRPLAEAQELYAQYDRELPFLRALSQIYQGIAVRQGYVTLFDGARRHFNLWAPGGKWSKGAGPCGREEALRRTSDPGHPWYHRGPLYRADTRNALNALIQGSAARHTKLWMRACWREGIVPLLQMHDALECSVATREQAEMVAQLGAQVIKLKVPMKVDLAFGRNWGDAKHTWDELFGSKPTNTAPTTEISEPTPPPIAEPIPPPTPQQAPEPPPLPQINSVAHDLPSEIVTVTLAEIIGEPLTDGKILCPFHDDHTPSLHIYNTHYHCFVCSAHGDRISWLMEVEGLEYAIARELVESWEPSGPPTPIDNKKTLQRALALWDAARPIAGTLAEQYLTSRHIDVTQLPTQALRFHPNCPFKGAWHPCLIALFRDVTSDAPAGIHRIALTPDGQKISRRMLGHWPSARAIKLWPAATDTLVVGEGLETVAAAATRIRHEEAPLHPAWALASAAALANLQPIEGINRILVLADNDPIGRRNALACAQCWANAQRTAILLTPDIADQDFNDLVKARAI